MSGPETAGRSGLERPGSERLGPERPGPERLGPESLGPGRRRAVWRLAAVLPLLLLWILPEEAWPMGVGVAAGWLEAALPVLAYGGLAWGFARTLRRGEEPLIARYTRFDGRSDPAACAGYARGLTLFWAVALGLATVAGGVAAVAGVRTGWTVDLVLLALFLAEHAVRSLRFPADGPATPARTLRAILRSEAARRA